MASLVYGVCVRVQWESGEKVRGVPEMGMGGGNPSNFKVKSSGRGRPLYTTGYGLDQSCQWSPFTRENSETLEVTSVS